MTAYLMFKGYPGRVTFGDGVATVDTQIVGIPISATGPLSIDRGQPGVRADRGGGGRNATHLGGSGRVLVRAPAPVRRVRVLAVRSPPARRP